jgi:glutamate 5-kinase
MGTSSITKNDGSLDLKAMSNLVDQISKAVKTGFKIILVTSGAIASGIAELGVIPNPNDIVFKQACAATGQSILMAHYRELFKHRGLKVAQVLLTKEDLSNRVSYIHTCNVLDRLIQLGVIPILNENDVTSIDEITPVMREFKVNFSDNDLLSVLIANATQANLVVILTTVDGLYNMDPNNPEAQLIPVVDKITSKLKIASEGKSSFGRGGMKTKLEAAEIAMQSGIPFVIANSRKNNVLLAILEKKPVGTYFKPTNNKLPSIKKWIAYGAGTKGQIQVNEGAEKAIVKGASLLAIGICEVFGLFQIGDVVSLGNSDGKEFAKGIVNYSSEEINVIRGLNTSQISKVLGYIRQKEIMHRKHMHLLEEYKR